MNRSTDRLLLSYYEGMIRTRKNPYRDYSSRRVFLYGIVSDGKSNNRLLCDYARQITEFESPLGTRIIKRDGHSDTEIFFVIQLGFLSTLKSQKRAIYC